MAMRSTATTLRAEWLSTDESQALAPPLPQRVGGRLGLAVAGKTPLLFPPTRMDSGVAVVKSAKFHMCSASLRRNPMVRVKVFVRYSSLPDFRLLPSAGAA
jgi:hypothetical protein